MAKEKSKPVIPKKDKPTFYYEPTEKYNIKVDEGDFVTVPVDDKGIPVRVVLPKDARKKK